LLINLSFIILFSYLPHVQQVSSADGVSQKSAADEDTDRTGHLALNYWCYPPDGNSFEQPYADNFWSCRWLEIAKDGNSQKH
jgi:hypothetical protein